MRVVFRTSPIPAVNLQPPNDTPVSGVAWFQALLYEPSEARPGGRTVAYWRSTLAPGQPLRVQAGPKLAGVPDAFVPAEVLRDLPSEAQLELRWQWTRGGHP